MANETIAYDKSDLRAVTKAFKAMDDEATAQAKSKSGALAEYAQSKIKQTASSLKSYKVASRIAAVFPSYAFPRLFATASSGFPL